MAAFLDQGFTQQWYDDLPTAFRDLDAGNHLWGFLRSLGDHMGGLSLTLAVMEGDGFIRPITLSNGSIITIGDSLSVVDAVIDGATTGAVLPLDAPVTGLDPYDATILAVVTGDWLLTDVDTLPGGWVSWVAQVLSVDLCGVPAQFWRAWIQSPSSRLTGSLAAIEEAVSWHVLDSIPYTVEVSSQWEVTVTVSDEAIVTSEVDLQAAVDGVAAAGVGVTLVLV